jgi:hypothetical protein
VGAFICFEDEGPTDGGGSDSDGGDRRAAGGGWAGHLGMGGVLPRLVVRADAVCVPVRSDVGGLLPAASWCNWSWQGG